VGRTWWSQYSHGAHRIKENYPDRKITSITYNSPIFERADPEKYFNENKQPMRFAVSGDPVSMFDMNARTTLKAPEFNLESIKNIGNVIANPTINNISKLIQKPPDPLLGLHTMNKTYSNPSGAMDFIKSAATAAATVSAIM